MRSESRARPQRRIFLTGATGHVGGRLLPALLERGEHVRCFARRPEAIQLQPQLDVLPDPRNGLAWRVRGARPARGDRLRRGSTGAGVSRITYLGGLGSGRGLSTHLASRQELGSVLASTGVETIEFRTSIVTGSGSLSFELVRSLTERLPVMITPRAA
jgi:uncharacterized protein YbjT (DUF2867 family)